MSAQYDNSILANNFGVTSLTTGAFTISGSNRAAWVGFTLASNSATVSSVSCGGQSCSLVSGADTSTAVPHRSRGYGCAAPATGSQTASVTVSPATDIGITAITATGCDQTTPLNNGNQNTHASGAGGSTVAVTITSTSGDLTVTHSYSDDNMTGTDQTLHPTPINANWNGDIGPGTGNTTHTWTDQNPSQEMLVVGANFQQVQAAGRSFLLGRH